MVSTAKRPGKIVQIIGSTFDVEFDEGHLPNISTPSRSPARKAAS